MNFEKEEKISEYLTMAWEEFLELERQHPDELDDFANGIKYLQLIIAMRYARFYKPEIFPNLMKGDN